MVFMFLTLSISLPCHLHKIKKLRVLLKLALFLNKSIKKSTGEEEKRKEAHSNGITKEVLYKYLKMALKRVINETQYFLT